MALSAGTEIGPYRVVTQIGSGGMGEVYRATDTKLGRDIAIKTLPSALANEPDRLKRFEREAKLLAALNHAHIGAIYGLDEFEGTQFIAMELVEGQTLEEKLKDGPLPTEDALQIGLQVAEALEAAHEKGVVHRDLKPANIMLTPDGVVKVLDFGLAKAFSGDPNEASPAHSPALSIAMTQQGLILGTAGYMSPEQASGQATDQRADIWAFGVVLYEMLTGLPLYSGESVPHILADVLRTEPDWNRLPKNLNPRLKQLLERCLKKKVRDRYHSIADARVDVEEVLRDPHGSPAAASSPTQAVRPLWRQALPAAAALLVGGVLVGLAEELLQPVPEQLSVNVKRTNILLGATESVGNTGLPAHVTLSPDGSLLAYAAQVDGSRQLYLRALDQLDIRPMAGTAGAFFPFFSPDGEWVGFYTDDTDGKLKKVSVRGGQPQTLADANFSSGASWIIDDTIIYGTGNASVGRSLFRIPANGGTPEDLIEPETDVGHIGPEVLPGGEAMLFVLKPGQGGGGPARDGRVAVLSLDTGEIRVLIDAAHTPRFVPTGHILFVRSGDLWAVPFDAERLQITGREVPVVEGVAQDGVRGGAAYAISNDGMLVYAPGGDSTLVGGANKALVWVDREGREEAVAVDPQGYWDPRLSPDGQRLAFSLDDGSNEDLWIIDLTRGTSSRVTFTPGDDFAALWTPDGQQIVFWSAPEGEQESGLFRQAANGTGQAERLTTSATVQIPEAISPDGTQLVFRETAAGGNDLHVLPLDGGGASQPLLQGGFFEGGAAISPNGRWVAYHTNESGRPEVYVRPFPNVNEGKWQVSIDGGIFPRWGPEGRELFFRSGDRVVTVTVEDNDAFSAGTPEVLFTGPYWINNTVTTTYDVSQDGQRFLMMRLVESQQQISGQTVLVAVENWFEELKRLAPPDEQSE